MPPVGSCSLWAKNRQSRIVRKTPLLGDNEQRPIVSGSSNANAGIGLGIQESVAPERDDGENETVFDGVAVTRRPANGFQAALEVGIAIVFGAAALIVTQIVGVAAGRDGRESRILESESVTAAAVGRRRVVETPERAA